jgi:hypothetical protein
MTRLSQLTVPASPLRSVARFLNCIVRLIKIRADHDVHVVGTHDRDVSNVQRTFFAGKMTHSSTSARFLDMRGGVGDGMATSANSSGAGPHGRAYEDSVGSKHPRSFSARPPLRLDIPGAHTDQAQTHHMHAHRPPSEFQNLAGKRGEMYAYAHSPQQGVGHHSVHSSTSNVANRRSSTQQHGQHAFAWSNARHSETQIDAVLLLVLRGSVALTTSTFELCNGEDALALTRRRTPGNSTAESRDDDNSFRYPSKGENTHHGVMSGARNRAHPGGSIGNGRVNQEGGPVSSQTTNTAESSGTDTTEASQQNSTPGGVLSVDKIPPLQSNQRTDEDIGMPAKGNDDFVLSSLTLGDGSDQRDNDCPDRADDGVPYLTSSTCEDDDWLCALFECCEICKAEVHCVGIRALLDARDIFGHDKV